jgi:cytochrome c oxidase subunit 2
MGIFGEILHKLFGFTLPERAAKNAYLVDDLYNAVLLLSILGFLGLMSVMVFFALRYHRSQNEKSAYIPHNALAETIWTVIPTIIFVGISLWGLWAYFEKEKLPEDALIVKVTGKQWAWEYTYSKDGQEFSTVGDMYLPIDKPVILEMTSLDVIHSFFIPSFRAKRDTVPGMISKMSFTPTELGNFNVFCTEFCGTSHSKMRSNVRVVREERFNKWINRQIKEANISDPVELGFRIYNNNCATCHSVDGSRVVGPSFKGIWGNNRQFESESDLVVNAEYIRESIVNPQAKIVKGYTAQKMNSFAGQFSEKELGYIVEYLKTLK